MIFAFVTFGNFDGHATLKRATGMASPLIERGHEVHLLLEESPINQEKVELECPKAIVHWHERGHSAWSERAAKQRKLKTIEPDVVWICGVGLRNWVRKTSKKTILLADHSELYSVVETRALRRLVYRFIEWLYCFSFDGHICASRYLEQFYSKRLKMIKRDEKAVHYSPYAYHPGVIKFDTVGADSVRARFPGKKIILFIGSFWENYGFWDMLKAFSELSDLRDDFVAVFAGRGPEKEGGIKWVRRKGLESKIIIEGYVPEESLSAYFGAAHAFLSPLRNTAQDWSRCPSKLFMYIPFQKPVITCAIGEACELFGESGFYYAPKDIESLVETISLVLDENKVRECVRPDMHTYEARTEVFLNWFETSFSK